MQIIIGSAIKDIPVIQTETFDIVQINIQRAVHPIPVSANSDYLFDFGLGAQSTVLKFHEGSTAEILPLFLICKRMKYHKCSVEFL